jgi:hypothetical protein
MYVYIYTHTHIHTHTYITYSYMHTYIHTYKHKKSHFCSLRVADDAVELSSDDDIQCLASGDVKQLIDSQFILLSPLWYVCV